MFEIFYFIGLSIGLGITVGCLIYLFFEDRLSKSKKTNQKSIKNEIREMEEMTLQNEINEEMALLRKRLGGV